MALALRRWAARVGSALALLVVILLISADLETVVALVALLVAGVLGYWLVRRSPRLEPVRTYLTPRRTRLLGVAVAVVVVHVVADEVSEGVWLATATALCYAGYRAGGVLRGAAYGAALAVACAALLVVSAFVLLVVGTIAGIPGLRELPVQVVFAPHVVGFVTAIYGGFALAVSGVVGLVSGTVGGAIARFTMG